MQYARDLCRAVRDEGAPYDEAHEQLARARVRIEANVHEFIDEISELALEAADPL